MTATAPAAPVPLTVTTLPEPSSRLSRFVRRQGWTTGVAVLLLALLFWRASQVPKFGAFEVRTVTAGTMSLAFLAMAQAVVVISGGIDLSVGSMLVFTNCLAARWMEGQGLGTCVALAVVVVAIAVVISTVIGIIITVSGIPDIVVTLAASFVLSGLALFVLSSPGGGVSADLQRRLVGGFSEPWPSVLWIVGALAVIWLPLKRSRRGIALYAVGSDRNAAFLSGVRVPQVRVLAYSVGGLFAGTAGIVTTAFTGSGEPRASIGANATLNSVAAVVLGGVALSGGVGGLVGPVMAAMCLTLIPAIMLGLGWDPSYAETARGVLIILVVMVGGLLQAKRKST
jgi:ribose transport system permease protein